MTRLVLFDIDGTLIQTDGAGVKAFWHAFATEFGFPRVRHGVRFAGRTDTSLAREIFRHNGVTPETDHFRRFFDAYVFWLDHYLHAHEGRRCPGVGDWLAALRELTPPPIVGLLTGNIRLGAEIKLRRFNLWEFFSTGAFADDHEDRDQIAAVARKRGNESAGRELRGEEIVVIGDTPLDIRCARAIGARMLAVGTGGATLTELRQHQPDWLVGDLRELSARAVCA